MSSSTASIRELRLNFPKVKQKVEEHGSIVITDRGVPSFKLSAMKSPRSKPAALPDYEAHLTKQKLRISREEGRGLHLENRGDR